MAEDTGMPLTSPREPAKLIENKTRLENKMLTRLTRQELLERKIIVSESAPSLHSSQAALEGKLLLRPSSEQLRERNILKGQGNVSPHIVDNQIQFRKAQMESMLNKKLSSRPKRETLIEQHILEDEEEASTTQVAPPKGEN